MTGRKRVRCYLCKGFTKIVYWRPQRKFTPLKTISPGGIKLTGRVCEMCHELQFRKD